MRAFALGRSGVDDDHAGTGPHTWLARSGSTACADGSLCGRAPGMAGRLAGEGEGRHLLSLWEKDLLQVCNALR